LHHFDRARKGVNRATNRPFHQYLFEDKRVIGGHKSKTGLGLITREDIMRVKADFEE